MDIMDDYQLRLLPMVDSGSASRSVAVPWLLVGCWVLVAAGVVGCQQKPTQQQSHADSVQKPVSSLLPSRTSSVPPPSSSPMDEELHDPPVVFGGPWVQCYAYFKPSEDLRADVRWLGSHCGSALGLVPAGTIQHVDLRLAALPLRHPIPMEAGQCLRVFGVGSSTLIDPDLRLLTASGGLLTEDGINDRWPILLPDQAYCVPKKDIYLLEIKAKKGEGSFAFQVWKTSLP
jgi:hypothetical protein